MNNQNKKKVLILMRDLRIGNGIATCIMNYYEYTVRQGFSIDFLLIRNVESSYVDTARKNGSRIYVLPVETSKPNKANRAYMKSVITKDYDVFHVNLSGYNALVGLEIAKSVGINTRIYHAHNPMETSSLKARLRSMIYEVPSVWFANKYAACSSFAGDSVFGKKSFYVLKNAMNTSKFIYDKEARMRLRKELELEEGFVVGVVGRIAEQKNPFFLIDVFSEIAKRRVDATLIWIGEGDMLETVKSYTIKKQIESKVHFLGKRTDVDKLYSAMDVFLLPSKFEGLGIVYIEAQISGLHCFASDMTPSDLEITERMHRISLKKPASRWAEIIMSYPINNEKRLEPVNTGFELSDMQGSLIQLYKQE